MNFFEYCCILYYAYRLTYCSSFMLFMGRAPHLHRTEIPKCRDCAFFEPVRKKNSSDELDYHKCVCNKFSKLTIDSDNKTITTPEYALQCRQEDHLCGAEGVFFHEAGIKPESTSNDMHKITTPK